MRCQSAFKCQMAAKREDEFLRVPPVAKRSVKFLSWSPTRYSRTAVKFRELAGADSSDTDSSAVIRNRVIMARQRQLRRFKAEKIFANAAMTPRMIRTHCRIDTASERMLESAMNRLGLSARAYDRILKVSRTIADLEGSDTINSTHVSEAVGYRSLDRTYWT